MAALDDVANCVPGCAAPAPQAMQYPPLLCGCGYPEPPPVVVPVPPEALSAAPTAGDRIAIVFDIELMTNPISPAHFSVTGSTPAPAPAITSAFVSALNIVTLVFAAPVTFLAGTVSYTAGGAGQVRAKQTGMPAQAFTVNIT